MDLYQTIEKHTRHWSRNSDGDLVLWFPGYQPQAMHDCEAELHRDHKLRAVSVNFDKCSGNTALIMRQPKKRGV